MIGSCRDSKSDEQIKLNMFKLVFIWMSRVHVGLAAEREREILARGDG